MPSTSIICGVLLILIGLAGYFGAGRTSFTALIPAAFGVVLAGLGLISLGREGLRKHLMHAAVAVALIGFIATAVRIVPKLGSLTFSAAELSQLSTSLICLAFVVFGVRSFIAARRSQA